MSEGDIPSWSRIGTQKVVEDDLLPLLETLAADAEYGFDFALASPLLEAAEWLGIGEIASAAITCRNERASLCLSLIKLDIGTFCILSGLRVETP